MPGRARGPERDPEEVARETCLRLLTARPRSRAELAAALAARGTPEEVAARVLDRFEELRWVDDGAFAEEWVQSRHATRGLSRRALGQELRRKGVAPETAETALAGLAPQEEEETAARLARRRAAATGHLDREVRVRRITAMLLRRGYPAGLATRAALSAVEATSDDGSGSRGPRGGSGEHADAPEDTADDLADDPADDPADAQGHEEQPWEADDARAVGAGDGEHPAGP